jgi:hypothetical protein
MNVDNEKELEEKIKEHLESRGYSVTSQMTIRMGDIGRVCTADLFIREEDLAIEVKTDQGSRLKGMGQCLSYCSAGHNSILISNGVSKRVEMVFAECRNNIPLIEVSEKEGQLSLNPIVGEKRYEKLLIRDAKPHIFPEKSGMKREYEDNAPDLDLSFTR